jgi:uncharacterized protein YukE
MATGGLTVKIKADASSFNAGMSQVRGAVSGISSIAGTAAKSVAALGAAFVGAGAAVAGITYKLIKWGEGADTADARTLQVIKSMGVFGRSATQVSNRLNELADSTALQAGVSGDTVQEVQALVATFKPLLETAGEAGGMFDRVVQAAIDMSAALGIDAKSAALQLSKALSDPINQMTALSRTGAILKKDAEALKEEFAKTGDESKLVATLMELVERQVSGAANATANGTERVAEALGQMRDELGRPFAQAFGEIADQIAADTPRIKAAIEEMAPQIHAGAKTAFAFIKEAFMGSGDELAQVGIAVGKLIGSSITAGIKASLRAAGAGVLGIFDVLMNDPLLAKVKATGPSNLGGQSISATGQLLGQDLIAALDQFKQDLPRMAVGANEGQAFRLAQPGEQSIFRDSLGRMVILLESANTRLNSIDQKTSIAPNFPQSP